MKLRHSLLHAKTRIPADLLGHSPQPCVFVHLQLPHFIFVDLPFVLSYFLIASFYHCFVLALRLALLTCFLHRRLLESSSLPLHSPSDSETKGKARSPWAAFAAHLSRLNHPLLIPHSLKLCYVVWLPRLQSSSRHQHLGSGKPRCQKWTHRLCGRLSSLRVLNRCSIR